MVRAKYLLPVTVLALLILYAAPAAQATGPPKGLPHSPQCSTMLHLKGRALYQHYAWHLFGHDYARANAIIWRESSWRHDAKNPYSTASGLAQWLAFWWDGSSFGGWHWNPFDWRMCLRVMRYVTQRWGWSAWGY
jgi:hypothetical protein